MDRRAFLRGAASACALSALAGCVTREPRAAATGRPGVETAREYPAPDLSDAAVLRACAGIRPYRAGRVRIEPETVGDTFLIHNYGHGGAGLTLCWGSAAEAVRLAREGRIGRPGPVAVLGAGAVGLATACELLRAGFNVRVYARATLDRTTSWVAGGQWAPSLVSRGGPPGDPGFFDRILRNSHARFAALEGQSDWGVRSRQNFVCGESGGGGLRHIPDDLAGPPVMLGRVPIRGLDRPGTSYRTMLVEPPVFLPRLIREARDRGAAFVPRTFSSMREVIGLPERVAVNCLGLGARDILDDPRLQAMRGQMVMLRPQALPYLLSHDEGYLFPRGDAVVLGGTVERGVEDPTPQDAACRRILAAHRRFFAGG